MSTIQLTMLANVTSINRGISQVNSQLGTFGKTAGRVSSAAKTLFAGFVVHQAVRSIKDVVTAASDAQQSLGATETVFGKYAKTVIDQSNKAATAIGLSANEYRELSNQTGALMNGAGVPLRQLAGLTETLNKRAADMAATFGGTTKDAVEAISSLMKGEADPIERYGVSIKESDVSARLAAKGLDHLTGAALKQAQMQARLDLLMQKSAKTQGAFARESGTLAHQQQVLSAQFDNLKAKVGSALLPAFTSILTVVNSNLVPAFKRLAPVGDAVKAAFDKIKTAAEPVIAFFKNNPEVIKGVAIALGIGAAAAGVFALAMGAVALATSPVVLTIAALAAVGGGFAYAYKQSETFRNAVDTVISTIKSLAASALPIINNVVNGIKAKWAEMAPALSEVWTSVQTIVTTYLGAVKTYIQTVVGVIQMIWRRFGSTIVSYISNSIRNAVQVLRGAFNIIAGIFKTIASVLKGDWKGAWDGIKQIVRGAGQVITGIVKQFMNIIKTVISVAWTVVKTAARSAWNSIKAVISGALGIIKSAVSSQFNTIRSVISGAWSSVKSLTSSAWNGIKTAVSSAINGMMTFVRGIPGKVTSALGNLGSLLYSAGADIIQGLIDGIQSKVGWVEDQLQKLTDKLPDWKGPKNRDKKLLAPTGKWIMEGLVKGLNEGTKGVKALLNRATDMIGDYFDKKFKSDKKARAATKRAIKSLADETKALMKNAKRRASIYNKLANAEKALADIKKKSADYAASVADSVVNFTSITGLNTAFTADAMAQQMQARLEQVKKFSALVKQLKNAGLNKTAIEQIVAAGADGGLATAQAIAAGGKESIKAFNELQKEIDNVATGLGGTAADSMYGAGIKSAEGLVKGLKSQKAQVEKTARQLGRAFAKAFNAAVDGKKSASSGRNNNKTNASQTVINLNGTFVGANKEQVGRWLQEALDANKRNGGRRLAV